MSKIRLPGEKVRHVKGVHPRDMSTDKKFPLGTELVYEGVRYRYCYKVDNATK